MTASDRFDQPKGPSRLPTVGVYRPAAWDEAHREVRLADGEVVRLKQRRPEIVVQTIGGALPPWATPSPVLSEAPDFEVVIIRDAHLVSDQDRQFGTGRLNLFWSKHRFAVVEAGAADLWLPGHQLQVRAARGDLELVAEALI